MKTMKACTRYFVLILALMMLFMAFATVAGAADGEEATAEAAQADSSGMKALAAAITVGLAAAAVQSGWALPSQIGRRHFPSARSGKQNPHRSDARPCVRGNRNHLRADYRRADHIRAVKRRCNLYGDPSQYQLAANPAACV